MVDLQHELIRILRKDCRVPLEQLAIMTGKDVNEVAEALQQLEDDKIILRYVPIINWDKTDRSFVEAMIEVKVTPQREQGFDALASRLYHFNEVKGLYLMSGEYDLLLMVEAADLKSLALFVSEKLSTFDTVISTSTSFVLKRYKSEGVIFEQVETDDRLVVSP
ncbi:MAG: Lrp/AsnC family transcriptional regulator [Christensenellaceae bacterium]|nr:Lrp/AsnC family transcriptional regulator [Christensenellaceae bacterium]